MKPTEGERLELADSLDRGLRVRATLARGVIRRVFYFRYVHRENGKKVPMRLGEYPSTTLADARDRAQAYRKDLDHGYI
jgi:hypothetical protein